MAAPPQRDLPQRHGQVDPEQQIDNPDQQQTADDLHDADDVRARILHAAADHGKLSENIRKTRGARRALGQEIDLVIQHEAAGHRQDHDCLDHILDAGNGDVPVELEARRTVDLGRLIHLLRHGRDLPEQHDRRRALKQNIGQRHRPEILRLDQQNALLEFRPEPLHDQRQQSVARVIQLQEDQADGRGGNNIGDNIDILHPFPARQLPRCDQRCDQRDRRRDQRAAQRPFERVDQCGLEIRILGKDIPVIREQIVQRQKLRRVEVLIVPFA